MTARQRLCREPDPRVRRSFVVVLVSALLLVLAGLTVVGLRVEQVHLAYRLDALRSERVRLETLLSQLEVEVATLRSPARIESRARRLGMTTPQRGQVRLAREYVTGASGLAAARLARTEAGSR